MFLENGMNEEVKVVRVLENVAHMKEKEEGSTSYMDSNKEETRGKR